MSESKQINPEVQTPRMFQPQSEVGRRYVFGYARSIRNTDQAVQDLFEGISVLQEDQLYPVPLIRGEMEKAIAYAFGEQFASAPDRAEAGLVDRVVLPLMSLRPGDVNFAPERFIHHAALRFGGPPVRDIPAYGEETRPYDVAFRYSKGIPIDRTYTLTVWTKYEEDMSQILEQILLKFSPIAYIDVEGVPWETPVKITGSANNSNSEVEDHQVRILKYVFNLTAESHIAQPVRRDKTVLKIIQKTALSDENGASQELEETVQEAGPEDHPQTPIKGD